MGTKTGLCPYCQTKKIQNKLFQVNPEASTCFCPTCMHEMTPKDAINGYNKLINNMRQKADETLFVTCDPVLAYQQYADILELEFSDAQSLLGRILCLIYMSKVRKSYLKEALILLQNTNYKGSDLNIFVATLKKINIALDEYLTAVKKKLSFRKFFYDKECLKLYIEHLLNSIEIKKEILHILVELKKKYVAQQNDVLINMMEHNISEQEKLSKQFNYLVTGEGFRFIEINKQGELVLEAGKTHVETKLSRYRMCTLDIEDKKNHYIKDQVFKDYTSTIRANAISIYMFILLYAITAGLVVTSVILKDDLTTFIVLLATGVAAFIGGTVFTILHITWKSLLKKRKMRVDN